MPDRGRWEPPRRDRHQVWESVSLQAQRQPRLRIHNCPNGRTQVLGEVQFEMDAAVPSRPKAGDGGELLVLEQGPQRVDLEMRRTPLPHLDATSLDFIPLDGDALDKLGHGRDFQPRWRIVQT